MAEDASAQLDFGKAQIDDIDSPPATPRPTAKKRFLTMNTLNSVGNIRYVITYYIGTFGAFTCR
ncbi:hypothetical protein [Alteromonas gracilis]|uniref:hypothetical protein n=1 Tax=Alteromonas gracilis TaxID=1479524 RepID=UPI0037350977